MPPPNHNRKKKFNRKTSNKSYIGKKSAGAVASKVPSTAASKNMPPLRPSAKVAAAPGPPGPPPRAVGLDRSVGPCDAMGDLCPHKTLENRRHFCYQCNEHCHAISPCGIPHPGFLEKLICNKCLAKEYPAKESDDDDEDVEASDYDPVGFGFGLEEEDGDDEMDRRFREANEIFMKSKSDSLNVDDILEENRRPLFNDGNPPSTRGLATNPRNLEATLDANKSDDDSDDGGGKPAAETAVVVSKKKTGGPVRRGREYTGPEYKSMALSWCQAAEDPKVGTGQKKEVFDRAVYLLYCNLIKKENEQIKRDYVIREEEDWPEDGSMDHLLIDYRDQKKIATRLGELKLVCNKFKGIRKQTPLASGEDEESRLARCLDLYQLQYQESFSKYYDAFCTFMQCHKWHQLDEAKDKSGGTKGRKKQTKAERDSVRAQKEQAKRPMGKRRKALNDGIAQACVDLGVGGNDTGDGLSGGILERSIAGLTDSIAIQMWPEVERFSYLKTQATKKTLEQKKEILMLEVELAELAARKRKATQPPMGDETTTLDISTSTASGSAEEPVDSSDDDEE